MNPDRTSLEWIEARKRHQLSHAHVQMARELGMNPKKLGKLDNHKQETWKLPLPRFIEELYEKRFGRARPEVVVTMEQRMAASRKKKDERRERKMLERDLEEKNGPSSPSPEKAATPLPVIDPRPEVNALLANLKKDKTRKALNVLVQACSGEWTYFDPVYRYYHQSFKVFGLQAKTLELVAALQALAPERKLNARFMKIVTEGTGKTFELEHNRRWDEVTRPIVEASSTPASSSSARCGLPGRFGRRRSSCRANGPPCSTSTIFGRAHLQQPRAPGVQATQAFSAALISERARNHGTRSATVAEARQRWAATSRSSVCTSCPS